MHVHDLIRPSQNSVRLQGRISSHILKTLNEIENYECPCLTDEEIGELVRE